ncbi:MAG: hypothetical protein ACRDQE_08970 [Gaiellales bacterium]
MLDLKQSSPRQRALAGAALLVALVALGGVTRAVDPGSEAPPVQIRTGPPFSLGHPGGPFARRVFLSFAEARFPAAITLPDVASDNHQNIGAVWADVIPRAGGRRVVHAVTVVFPRAGVAVQYATPVAYPDPESNYRGYVSEGKPGDAAVIDLNGTPALLIHYRDDPTRDPGSVEFVSNGVVIAVIGRRPDAALTAVATSIQRQARST